MSPCVPTDHYGIDFVNAQTGWACSIDNYIIHYTTKPPKVAGPTSLDFGTLLCTSMKDDSIFIRNVGLGPMNIMGALFTGTHAGEFTLISPASGRAVVKVQDSTCLVVRWNAASAGTKTATLRVITNDPTKKYWDVVLTARKDSVLTEIIPLTIDFDTICVGSTKTKKIAARSTGTLSSTLSEFEWISGEQCFALSSPQLPAQLTLNATDSLELQFVPAAYGSFSSVYRFKYTPCNREVHVTLRGTANSSFVSIAPDTLFSFGDVQLGKSQSQTFTIQNTGNKPSRIASIGIQPPSPDFTIAAAPPTPLVLNPGDQRTVTVKCAPSKLGTLAAKLRVEWDAACAGKHDVFLDAMGINSPEITAQTTRNILVPLCSTIVFDTLLVRNTGGSPLLISSANFSGKNAPSFLLLTPQLPITIAPSDTARFAIQFFDNVAGSKSATLAIWSNDPKKSPFEITFTAQREIAAFAVRGDTVQAMEACIGEKTRRTLSVVNTGSVQLVVKKIVALDSGAFMLTSATTPATLEPNESTSIEIEFKPTSVAQSFARYLIVAEPCARSQVVTVQGVTLSTGIVALPPSVHFGDVSIGSYGEQTIDYANTGTTTIIIDTIYFVPTSATLSIDPPPSLPLRLNAGEKLTLAVRFTPTTLDTTRASLCLRAASPCGDTIRLTLDGVGTRTQLTIDRSTLRYTLSPCDAASRCDTVQLANAGTAPVEITTVTITQSATIFALAQSPSLPIVLSGGKRFPIIACASAQFTGDATATLVITSTDATRPVITIPLAAHRDSAALSASQTMIDFDIISSCDTAQFKTITVRNLGSIADTLRADAIHDPAFTLETPLPLTLEAGEAKQLVIRFSPMQNRVHADSVVLRSKLCHREMRIHIIGERTIPVYTATPIVIDLRNVRIGSVKEETLRVLNANAYRAQLAAYQIQPLFADLRVMMPAGWEFDANETREIIFQFTSRDTVQRTSIFCLIFNKPCRDTLCVKVMTQGVRGALSLSKSQLTFGALAQCQSTRDTVMCTNSGSAPITITATTITGGGAAAYSLLNPTTAPEVIAAGASRSYVVAFQPLNASDGPVAATLTITTNDPSTPPIDVALRGERVTQLLPTLAAIDFGSVSVGTSRARTLTIRNSGTSRFCIDRISTPMWITASMSLPICLQPNEQRDVALTFTPQDTSMMNGSLTLHVDQPCIDSVLCSLSGKGIAGGITQTQRARFGIVASCLAARDTIEVRNAFSANARITSASITGADAQLFIIVEPSAFPHAIAPNGDAKIVLEFKPQSAIDGVKAAACIVDYTVDTTSMRLTTQLDATTITPALTVPLVVFQSTEIGSSAMQRIVLANTNPFPITVASITITDTAFSIASTTPPLPETLLPGERIDVTIRFTPVEAKAYRALFAVQSSAPCIFTASDTLSGIGATWNVTAVGATIGTYHAKLDEVITIPITLDMDVGSLNVASWSGSVAFNRTMLYPQRVIRENTLSQAMNITDAYDHRTGTWSFAATGAALLAGSQPLLGLELRVLLGNAIETPITLQPSFDFTSGAARIMRRQSGLFQLEGYCRAGDRLLRIEGTNALHQNRPNPVSQFNNDVTKMRYELALDGHATLVLYDAMGRSTRTLVDEWKRAGIYELDVDTHSLTPGVYWYILRCGTFSATKKLVVMR